MIPSLWQSLQNDKDVLWQAALPKKERQLVTQLFSN
jgi:hypothetical protein